MKRFKEWFWPIVGLLAVILSLQVLYEKLRGEAASDADHVIDPSERLRIALALQ